MIPTVDVLRGGLVESRHRVSVAVVDAAGTLVARAGDPDLVTFWRSAAKFFQAIPLLTEGAAEALGITDAELGVAVKVEDGDFRSSGPALLAALDQLAPGCVPVADDWRTPAVKNTRGAIVGRMEAHVPLRASE